MRRRIHTRCIMYSIKHGISSYEEEDTYPVYYVFNKPWHKLEMAASFLLIY